MTASSRELWTLRLRAFLRDLANSVSGMLLQELLEAGMLAQWIPARIQFEQGNGNKVRNRKQVIQVIQRNIILAHHHVDEGKVQHIVGTGECIL